MDFNNIPNSLFVKNRKSFSDFMASKSIAVFCANEPMPRNGDQFFPFRQQSDFFYLTGIKHENAFLILYPDSPNPDRKEILFIETYNENKVIWQGEMLDTAEASRISGVKTVLYSDSFYDVLNDIVFNCDKIYLNSYEYPRYQCDVATKQQRFAEDIKRRYPLHNIERSAPILNRLRLVKSKEELDITRHACDITGQAFRRCLDTVRPGKYEYQIQAEIEYVFKSNNASGHAFAPIVAGGKNGCCLHYSSNNSILNDNDLVLFDIGCEYNHYSSDLSRTIPVNGHFTPRQKQCYDAVLRVMKQIEPLYVIGNTINDINTTTYKLMEQEMIGLGLFTTDDIKRQDPDKPLYTKYLMHGISHHIGIDVHDNVNKSITFKEGMILTCEPGIYIREENIGIRIENDMLVTSGQPVNLFEGLPIEVDEIEYAMNKNIQQKS